MVNVDWLSLHFILLVAYFYSLKIIDRKNNRSFYWRKKNMYIYIKKVIEILFLVLDKIKFIIYANGLKDVRLHFIVYNI